MAKDHYTKHLAQEGRAQADMGVFPKTKGHPGDARGYIAGARGFGAKSAPAPHGKPFVGMSDGGPHGKRPGDKTGYKRGAGPYSGPPDKPDNLGIPGHNYGALPGKAKKKDVPDESGRNGGYASLASRSNNHPKYGRK